MIELIKMTLKSLLYRKTSTILTVLSICVSTILLLSIEKIKTATRSSFEGTLSQIDLIVGARSSPLQILLYSVFRIGDATNNIRYTTLEKIKSNPEVKFTIPISLGDSHKGFRVIGTTQDYFTHYKYRGGKNLKLTEGRPFETLYEVVLGSDIAQKLRYKIGDKITLSHGADEVAFQEHTDSPFTVVGVFAATHTPVDQSLHISLESIEAIHVGWENGALDPSKKVNSHQLKITQLTAFLVGLNSRTSVFNIKREIDNFEDEPLTAVLPGVVFTDLWQNLSFIENILKVLSLLVFISSLISLLLVLLSSLNERRRELAILRSLGASSGTLFQLLLFESILLTSLGLILGVLLHFGALIILKPILEAHFGLMLNFGWLSLEELKLIGFMLIIAIFVSLWPSFTAYRKSISDGLTPQV